MNAELNDSADLRRRQIRLQRAAWDHGLREGGLYHENCVTCAQIKRDAKALRALREKRRLNS